MIRHRPHGLGHAYRLEPDQRVPARPVEGEPVILGATTGSDVTDLSVELIVSGQTRRLPLEPVRVGGGPTAGTGATTGHLAAAAARLVRRGRQAWSVRLDPLVAGTHVAYRFIDDGRGQRTRRFDFARARVRDEVQSKHAVLPKWSANHGRYEAGAA